MIIVFYLEVKENFGLIEILDKKCMDMENFFACSGFDILKFKKGIV